MSNIHPLCSAEPEAKKFFCVGFVVGKSNSDFCGQAGVASRFAGPRLRDLSSHTYSRVSSRVMYRALQAAGKCFEERMGSSVSIPVAVRTLHVGSHLKYILPFDMVLASQVVFLIFCRLPLRFLILLAPFLRIHRIASIRDTSSVVLALGLEGRTGTAPLLLLGSKWSLLPVVAASFGRG